MSYLKISTTYARNARSAKGTPSSRGRRKPRIGCDHLPELVHRAALIRSLLSHPGVQCIELEYLIQDDPE